MNPVAEEKNMDESHVLSHNEENQNGIELIDKPTTPSDELHPSRDSAIKFPYAMSRRKSLGVSILNVNLRRNTIVL